MAPHTCTDLVCMQGPRHTCTHCPGYATGTMHCLTQQAALLLRDHLPGTRTGQSCIDHCTHPHQLPPPAGAELVELDAFVLRNAAACGLLAALWDTVPPRLLPRQLRAGRATAAVPGSLAATAQAVMVGWEASTRHSPSPGTCAAQHTPGDTRLRQQPQQIEPELLAFTQDEPAHSVMMREFVLGRTDLQVGGWVVGLDGTCKSGVFPLIAARGIAWQLCPKRVQLSSRPIQSSDLTVKRPDCCAEPLLHELQMPRFHLISQAVLQMLLLNLSIVVRATNHKESCRC